MGKIYENQANRKSLEIMVINSTLHSATSAKQRDKEKSMNDWVAINEKPVTEQTRDRLYYILCDTFKLDPLNHLSSGCGGA